MSIIRETFRTNLITLAGPAVYQSLYTAETAATVRVAKVIYDEASSVNAGVAFRIGKIGSASFFGSYTTEISKAIGSVSNLVLAASVLQPGETIIVECDGNKTGAGIISVQMEIYWEINS